MSSVSVKMGKMRNRWCSLVLYPESQAEAIEKATTTYPCVWITHDKDKGPDGEPMKPHVHILCHFGNARYFSGIAKELAVPEGAVNRVDNPEKAFAYLTHDNNPEKYQYDKADLCFHDFAMGEAEQAGAAEEEQVVQLLEMPQGLTRRQAARWALENGCWAAYRRGYVIFRDIREEEAALGSARARAERIEALDRAAQYEKEHPVSVVMGGAVGRLVAASEGQPWTGPEQ